LGEGKAGLSSHVLFSRWSENISILKPLNFKLGRLDWYKNYTLAT